MSVPAKALWVDAPLSEKHSLQCVLAFVNEKMGFLAPVTNEPEAVALKYLVRVSEHPAACEVKRWWAWLTILELQARLGIAHVTL
jgi:hypothetical protein